MALERIRMLYQGAQVPTLFMLLAALACGGLLWQTHAGSTWLLGGWLLWVVLLAVLQLYQVALFKRLPAEQQARPRWQWLFLAGSFAGGLSLAFAVITLVPPGHFMLQALIYGMIAGATLSAATAYAVCLFAFLAFALPCLLPSTLYLLLLAEPGEQGWGLLALILLLSLVVVAWQINRMAWRGQLKHFENEALIGSLEQARQNAETVNHELAREVGQRRQAESALRAAHDQLEQRVQQRTSELDAANRALHASGERLSQALEASALGLWDWNLGTDKVFHTRLEELFGICQEDVTGVLSHLKPRLHPDDQPALRQALIEHLKGGSDGYCVEYRIHHTDGRWLWIEDRGRAVERDANGHVLRMLGTRRDITANKQQDEQQQLAATVFEAASEGILILDADYQLLAVNQAFSDVTGYRREEVIGRSVLTLIPNKNNRRQYQLIREELERSGQWRGELLESRKSGELYPQWLQLKVVRDRHGQASHIVGFFSDLSQRRQTEERLRYLSNYDELTGLANRNLFLERLHSAAERVQQQDGSLALLHIDLDRFKALNDSLGHELADQLLRQVARRISQAVPEASMVARLSGDEFALLLDDYNNISSLARTASRLLGRLRTPLDVGGHELVVSASLGIALLPENARGVPILVSQAGMAMQHAKHLGGNSFQFYTDNLQACTLERLQLEYQLRKALMEDQLEVWYQPKLRLSDRRIHSAEALVRWRHPQLGLVPPGDFIPLAEETGLITPIGEFVLRTACQHARQWLNSGLQLRVSVNLSMHQLRQGNLVSLVRQILADSSLPAHLLELELTESHLLDNVESVIETFQQLRSLGVKLAIDDFGTGYSSLSYLKRFPVDCVKIDQSFIRDLREGSEDAAIVRAIIAMAHGLGLSVVAEGVETQTQLDLLADQQCDDIQGYLISPPLPARQFIGLFEL